MTTSTSTSRKSRSRSPRRRQPHRSRPRATPKSGPRDLPERGVLDDRLELFDRLRVNAGAQVLPAVVGRDEDDVALIDLARDAYRDRRYGAGGDAHEEALLLEQLLRPHDCVAIRHEDLPVQQRQIDDRRDEAVLERT